MLIFLAPRAPATSPSMPGWSGTVMISCLAFGIGYSSSRNGRLGLSLARCFRRDPKTKRHQPRAENPVEGTPHGAAAQPIAHPIDGDRICDEPGEGEQAEI